ncbi:hypothetical protein ABS642_02320 [Microbacterium sp. A8/3-1]|uniref:Uncharacterized protein n=1 Tax=Microbacterium sp. A8/3-1 TaxID=3160749 RepID=A0AAU7VZI8_9MICO
MSTSDQQDHGPLTRKQLREIRLTGSTPVITPEEAAAAAETAPPAPPLPRASEPVEIPPAPAVPDAVDDAGVPLTRRQVREQERIKTGAVPVGEEHAPVQDQAPATPEVIEPEVVEPEVVEPAVVEAEVVEPEVSAPETVEPQAPEFAVPTPAPASSGIVSGVPDFSTPAPADTAGDDDDIDDEIVVEPVRASEASDSVGAVPLEVVEEPADADRQDDVAAVLGLSAESSDPTTDDVLADVEDADDDDVAADPRPTVNPAFGEGVLADAPDVHAPFRPSFDELLTVGDSTGSQHSAPNALIFTPSPGEGSLSGPVASTGEILVTGSYELPKGLGSQGHAHGTTDGKDVDAVLIDGELPPASSPTPIAASSAVSTIKPAGEVIRPPAPEKGNKLMLILAIVAGGLALALGVALIFAFTTNVF